MDAESFALALLAGAKWITYVGLVGLTGAVGVHRLASTAVGEAWNGAVERRLVVLAAGSASILLAGTAARLYAQTWSVFGLDEPVTLELVRVIGVESRWGGNWQPQAGFALLAMMAVAVSAWRPRVGWWIAALAAAGAWITLPMTGHAMSSESRLPWIAQVAHGIAAGAWIGALAALVAIVSGVAREARGHGRTAVLGLEFSPMARVAVGVVVLSGVLTAFFYLRVPADLWTTGYGRVLLLKVGLFLVTGAVGAYNWRILLPRLGNEPGTRALLRSARLELVLAAGVLLVTAVLVHLAMPAEMG